MSHSSQEFLKEAETESFDNELHRKLNYNILQYSNTVKKGVLQYNDVEVAKQRAKNIKWKTMENLDKYLIEFEKKFTANGGKVIWAETTEQAQQEIKKILQEKNCKRLVKSKSMITEEIHLNDFLAKENIESVETDLGEYIQQMDGEPPFHIVTPAMHKSKEDAARVFHEHHGTPLTATPQELTMFARKTLREKYVTAEVGVTGANFIVADVGGILVLENEGNARLCTAFPKTHIVIVGIEKMIPSIYDLNVFLPLLSTYGTGQQVSVNNALFMGPRQENEVDGPDEMYVVLLDNGRTNLLAQAEQREALYCIRCGACLNACPVYKNIGGFSYGTTYTGPIGSVISPHLKGMEEFKHLSYASSLCGNCTEVCPMKINLHNLLVINRHDAVKEGHFNRAEKIGWDAWRRGMLSRKMMNMASAKTKNFLLNFLFKKTWGKRRAMPMVYKSFNERWNNGKS